MTALYGIANCDTIRKARRWLDERGVAYDFRDYRKDGIDRTMLEGWVDELGWEALLNRTGTTFRKLPEADRSGIDRTRAMRLMLVQPAMIRRPVLDTETARVVGFAPERYATLFA